MTVPGRFQVEVAGHAGFCAGVKDAVSLVEAATRAGRRVFVYGPLAHNPQVERDLAILGVRTVNDLTRLERADVAEGEDGADGVARAAVAAPPGTPPVLVIPSHGAPPRVYRSAAAAGYEILDTTCPLVRRLQEAARRAVRRGECVVIVGDPSHTEVQGVLGHAVEAGAGGDPGAAGGPRDEHGDAPGDLRGDARGDMHGDAPGDLRGDAPGDGMAMVVRDPEEARSIIMGRRITVVAQTTQRRGLVEEVAAALRSPDARVEVIDTLCPVTSKRQAEARELAARCDVILVLGGRNSANTRQLAYIAKEKGIPTYHIEQASELCEGWFRGRSRVGVLAGASTPASSIEEVREEMAAIEEREEEKPQQDEVESPESPEQPQAEKEAVREEASGEEQAIAEEEEDMASAMKDLKPGEIVRGRIVSVDENQVLVDVGYKSEGIIPASDFGQKDATDLRQLLQVGDEIDVYVKRIDSQEGNLILSKRRADEEGGWRSLKTIFETGELLTAPVISEVKGGLIVDVGVRGFLPASHVDRGFVKDLAKFVGQTVTVKVIELDRSKNQVILSRKVAMEEEQKAKRDSTWVNLNEGVILHGTVKRLTDFGAFVDLGGVDGLLHVSELSWGRVNHPSEVLKEGQEVDVIVLRLDRERDRISLGYKQIQPDPWSRASESYREGSIVEGKVVRLAPFGAFIELEAGIDGLVHISQLADRRVAKPDDVVTVGEMVKVKVLGVSPKDHRISLSLREAAEPTSERSASAPSRRQREPRDRMEPAMNQEEEVRVTLGDMFGTILAESKRAAVEAEKENGRKRTRRMKSAPPQETDSEEPEDQPAVDADPAETPAETPCETCIVAPSEPPLAEAACEAPVETPVEAPVEVAPAKPRRTRKTAPKEKDADKVKSDEKAAEQTEGEPGKEI
jgi:4-hydroxy-3-methylbut-2-enyl diphosphate reductase IspH/predicted RNA-binding protein with RPS1 domain